MPELMEQMYCHQQICIPPTFPYLLRQYAKAAIRSQPTDLLKWSTAYFRCLSLNVPPPVKPRLEYPIPRDYVGITPGWLRALNYQLQNNQTVPFKILWDRWIGACLQHDTLIKILCLGGFTDALAIPWNRFIGLCAGHLTDNLTQTMIMFCEILTEEPEGGCAMVPLETFLDVYRFLAAIDASEPQTLLNLYFTDAALNLFPKEKKKAIKEASLESEPTVELSTPTPEEVAEEQILEIELMGEGSIISCPDIIADDALLEPDIDEERVPDSRSSVELITLRKVDDDEDIQDDDDDEMKLLTDAERTESRGEQGFEELQKPGVNISVCSEETVMTQQEPDSEAALSPPTGDGNGEDKYETEEKEETGEKEEKGGKEQDEYEDDDADGVKEPETDETEDDEGEVKRKSIIEQQLKQVEQDIFEKGGIELGEDDDLEEEPADICEMPSGELQSMEDQEIVGEGTDVDELEEHIRIKYQEVSVDEDLGQEEEAVEEEEEERPEEVEVDAIPGIGPIVPKELVQAVENYLTSIAAEEHGMTMPRHIRHYTCPPLEVFQ